MDGRQRILVMQSAQRRSRAHSNALPSQWRDSDGPTLIHVFSGSGTVMNHVSRIIFFTNDFSQLLQCPSRTRVRRDIEMH